MPSVFGVKSTFCTENEQAKVPSNIFCNYSNNEDFPSDTWLNNTKLEINIPKNLSKCALLFDDNKVSAVQTANSTKSSSLLHEATKMAEIQLLSGTQSYIA